MMLAVSDASVVALHQFPQPRPATTAVPGAAEASDGATDASSEPQHRRTQELAKSSASVDSGSRSSSNSSSAVRSGSSGSVGSSAPRMDVGVFANAHRATLLAVGVVEGVAKRRPSSKVAQLEAYAINEAKRALDIGAAPGGQYAAMLGSIVAFQRSEKAKSAGRSGASAKRRSAKADDTLGPMVLAMYALLPARRTAGDRREFAMQPVEVWHGPLDVQALKAMVLANGALARAVVSSVSAAAAAVANTGDADPDRLGPAARQARYPAMLLARPVSVARAVSGPVVCQVEASQAVWREVLAAYLSAHQSQPTAHQGEPRANVEDGRGKEEADDRPAEGGSVQLMVKLFRASAASRRSIEYARLMGVDHVVVNLSNGDKLLVYERVAGKHTPSTVGQVAQTVLHACEVWRLEICHGDVRGRNIVFGQRASKLIDFDMAQKEDGQARYPETYRHGRFRDVQRHNDALAGEVMRRQHDAFALHDVLSRYEAADGDATVPYMAMLRQLEGMGEAEHWEDGNVERLERAAHELLLHHGGAEVRPCEQQPAQSSSSGDGDRGTGSPTKAGEQGATAGDGERRKE